MILISLLETIHFQEMFATKCINELLHRQFRNYLRNNKL